jgi:beta-lactam-binding protein with PASTA domain
MSLKAKAASGSGLVVVATLVIMIVTGVINFPAPPPKALPAGLTYVPSVVNSDIDEAKELLSNADLQDQIGGNEFSVTVIKDRVLGQDLAPGPVVDVNTILFLTLSAGPRMVDVPYIEDRERYTRYRERLEELGFVVKETFKNSAVFPNDTIISQSPEGGALLIEGGTIELVIAVQTPTDGIPRELEVPNLRGKTLEQIDALFPDDGKSMFEINISYEYSSATKGTIISQSLTAGELYMTYNELNITVSKGVLTSNMPDLQYKTLADARAKLDALEVKNLTLNTSEAEDKNIAKGLIISQTPAANTQIESGAVISIVISQGPPPPAMVDVRNMTEADARAAIVALGLKVTVVYNDSDTSVAIGSVISQGVSAGTKVPFGDYVTITVRSEKPQISVPNVTGMTKSEAESALKNLKFKVTSSEAKSSAAEKGKVISQNPKSGSKQPEGSTITITVGSGVPQVKVPYVVKSTETEAKRAINNAGLKYDVDYKVSTGESGIVLSQNPSSGTVDEGTTIYIVVSIPDDVTVPNVLGSTKATAESQLTALGLKVSYATEEYSSTYASGKVMAQSPRSGTIVDSGSTITLTKSKGE